MGDMKETNDESKKNGLVEVKAAAAAAAPQGTCAVDIRLFLLTITLAMSAAFFMGVFVHIPWEHFVLVQGASNSDDNNYIADHHHQQQLHSSPTSRLALSPADLVTAGSHSPSGQHLLVDMIGIEAAFLDSEERLSDAMVRTVQGAELTMLSYHCHKLEPAGISCVGVLMESHISFHTWPEEGVITLDLFTCGANPLMPVLPVIERLFGIGENVKTKWSHELRGFRSPEEKRTNYLDDMSDLSVWILSPLDLHYKKQVYSQLTKYQRVDIWDMVEKGETPSYEDGIKHNLSTGDKRWSNSDLTTPDRILFLDGTVQSLYSSEATYHESLVHPAMFAHPNPKNVAVLGGGEGATIREVLKHKMVESVTMIEIDEELIQIARDYLPKMSDCSDFIGRANNCFDDDLVTVVTANAVQYFLDQYGPGRPVKEDEAKPLFDVLIVDALDPEDDVVFANDLYADDEFVSAMVRSLTDFGILLIQIGTAAELSDPMASVGMYQTREKLFNLFEGHPDVAALHVYEEPKSGFLEPHSFIIVCKDISCQNQWYARSDVVDYEIYDRILPTKSGKPALKYYDGVNQYNYQVPPKAWESVYCRREPTPFECAYRSLDMAKEIHDFYWHDDASSSFRVEFKPSPDDASKTFGSVIAKVDIPMGSYIMPEHLARSLVLNEGNVEDIKKTADMGLSELEEFKKFIDFRAHKSQNNGSEDIFLEVGASIFIRDVDSDEEANVGRWVPPHPMGKRPPYSPVYDRHRMSFNVFMVATRDIPAGAELTRSKTMWSSI